MTFTMQQVRAAKDLDDHLRAFGEQFLLEDYPMVEFLGPTHPLIMAFDAFLAMNPDGSEPGRRAWEFLRRITHAINEPPDGNPYRAYEIADACRRWLGEAFDPAVLNQKEDVPHWDGTALRFGGTECCRYKKAAPRQTMILKAFEDAKWQPTVEVALDKETLEQAIKDLAAKLRKNNSPIAIGSAGEKRGARWYRVRV